MSHTYLSSCFISSVRLSLFCTLLLMTQTGHSQWSDTTYDFSSFVLPLIDYQSLQFSASLNGNTDRYESTQFNPVRTYSDLNSGASLSYFRFQNSERIQHRHDLGFSFSERWNRNKTDEIEREFRITPSLAGNHQWRWYRESRFVELDLLHNSFITPRYTKDDSVVIHQLSAGLRLRPTFLLGKGRIDPITDVTIAQFLLQDLYSNGLLSAEISNDDLNALGHQIASARYRRIFDYREQFKYQLASIDSLIRANGWVNGYSIDYFTILADNWLYDFRTARSQGRRLSYGIAPQFYYDHLTMRDKSVNPTFLDVESNARAVSIHALIKYENEKPLSISRQRFSGIAFSVGYDIIEEDHSLGFDADFEGPGANLKLYYGFGYYPNSRTAWTNEIESNVRAQYWDEEFGHAVELRFSSSMAYYLSPRARIDGNLSLSLRSADNFTQPILNSGFPPYFDSQVVILNGILFSSINDRLSAYLDIRFVYQLF